MPPQSLFRNPAEGRRLTEMATLAAFVAAAKREILDDLTQKRLPSRGRFDEKLLHDAFLKATPQMGTTVYHPNRATLEFIYPDLLEGSLIVKVELDLPERVVFMPVPEWVIETIWQGDVDGSYHFESDAFKLLNRLTADLEPGTNDKFFGRQAAKRRE